MRLRFRTSAKSSALPSRSYLPVRPSCVVAAGGDSAGGTGGGGVAGGGPAERRAATSASFSAVSVWASEPSVARDSGGRLADIERRGRGHNRRTAARHRASAERKPEKQRLSRLASRAARDCAEAAAETNGRNFDVVRALHQILHGYIHAGARRFPEGVRVTLPPPPARRGASSSATTALWSVWR